MGSTVPTRTQDRKQPKQKSYRKSIQDIKMKKKKTRKKKIRKKVKRSIKKEKYPIGAAIKEPGSTIKNKTGSWRTLRPKVDEKKCTRCGICWSHCPDNAIKITKEKGAVINFDYCKGCGICAATCPFKAIIMEKEEK